MVLKASHLKMNRQALATGWKLKEKKCHVGRGRCVIAVAINITAMKSDIFNFKYSIFLCA